MNAEGAMTAKRDDAAPVEKQLPQEDVIADHAAAAPVALAAVTAVALMAVASFWAIGTEPAAHRNTELSPQLNQPAAVR